MTEPQQPITLLAQMLAEVAAMNQDQAALGRQQLATLQDQAEWQTKLLESLVDRIGAAAPAPSLAGVGLHKMTPEDDPDSFLGMFEATAEACRWPEAEWAVRLLPLLSGDAQTVVLSLPARSRGRYADVRRAVLDRLGYSAEDHRCRFRRTKLGPTGRPFIYAQQLNDAATRWLQPGDSNGEQRMLGQIVLEQFLEGLPTGTAEWVRCHRPTDLETAITLAEDHRADFLQGRTPDARPASLSRPTPAPRRRLSTADSQHTSARPSPLPRTNLSCPLFPP